MSGTLHDSCVEGVTARMPIRPVTTNPAALGEYLARYCYIVVKSGSQTSEDFFFRVGGLLGFYGTEVHHSLRMI